MFIIAVITITITIIFYLSIIIATISAIPQPS